MEPFYYSTEIIIRTTTFFEKKKELVLILKGSYFFVLWPVNHRPERAWMPIYVRLQLVIWVACGLGKMWLYVVQLMMMVIEHDPYEVIDIPRVAAVTQTRLSAFEWYLFRKFSGIVDLHLCYRNRKTFLGVCLRTGCSLKIWCSQSLTKSSVIAKRFRIFRIQLRLCPDYIFAHVLD